MKSKKPLPTIGRNILKIAAEIRAAYEALAVDAMVSKPFDGTNCAPLALGIKPGAEDSL